MSVYDDSPEAHAHHRRKMRDVQKWTLEHTPYEVGDPFSPCEGGDPFSPATQVHDSLMPDARESFLPNTLEGALVADPNRVSYWPPTISEAGADVSNSRTGGGGARRPAPQRVHTAPQVANGQGYPRPPLVPPMHIPPPPLLRVQTAPHSLPVYPVAGMETYGPAGGYPPMVPHPPLASHPPIVCQPPIPRTRKPSKSTRPGTPIPGGPAITVTAPTPPATGKLTTPPAKLRKKTSLAALFKSSRTNLATQSTPQLVGASGAELVAASKAQLVGASGANVVDTSRSWYKTSNASTTQLDPSRSWYKHAPKVAYDPRKATVVTDKQPTSVSDKQLKSSTDHPLKSSMDHPPRSPTNTKKPAKKLVKDIFNIGGKPRERSGSRARKRAQTLQSAASDQQAQPGLQPQLVVLPPLVSAFQQDPVPTFQHDAVPIPSHIKVFPSPDNVTTVAIDAEGGSHGRRHRSRSRERRHRERSRERHRERKDEHHSHRSPTRDRHREDREDRGHHKSSRHHEPSRHHGSSRDEHKSRRRDLSRDEHKSSRDGHGSSRDAHGSRDGHRSDRHRHDRDRSEHRHAREDKPREREHRSRHH